MWSVCWYFEDLNDSIMSEYGPNQKVIFTQCLVEASQKVPTESEILLF